MVLASPDTAAASLKAASPVVADLGDAWIVGGAVRDALLGLPSAGRDLDAVDEADAVARARALHERLGGELTVHDRFGTATLAGDGWRVDLATARAERYPRAGALPEVTVPAPLEEDLQRRDFTVNAIALRPDGTLRAVPGAVGDLEAQVLRVLHPRSFVDDPTRLFRLARYAARLGFAIEPETERLAREAFAAGAPETAGAARVGAEMLALFGEEPEVALRGLEILHALGAGYEVDDAVARGALTLLPPDGSAPLLLLAAVLGGVPAGWHVARPAPVLDAARDPARLAGEMNAASDDFALHRLLRSRSSEAIALAGAHGAHEPAARWFGALRDVKLDITGDDLVAAGVPQGPEIGRRLDVALARRLNDGVTGRDAQLAAALAG